MQLVEEAISEAHTRVGATPDTNKQTRDRETADVASLTAEIKDLTAQITQRTQVRWSGDWNWKQKRTLVWVGRLELEAEANAGMDF